ncbi:alkene reductase [Limnobacter litoralis]|uniref:Alkene reductase n=1 Tax=Limnobacter litoralis TaxID=481366 RepID=A0ABQ5YW41_9BURK|nr:alkene reductase [Limnobacter litoralis]GLR27615.1 alkene reductase [Limnobacter litoralis]
MTTTAVKDHPLFKPFKLGSIELKNRIVLAPLTRNRASAGNVPNASNVTYYRQRSTAGLIISEATQISPQGVGYPNTPGIHTDEQVAGWKGVVKGVHEEGGKIFLQLWHVGRISHSSLQPDGALPVAPSAVKPHEGMAMTYEGMKEFETPRALELSEIPGIVADYRRAAERALEAGFDGIEVHAANGYLLDQFLRDGSNKRTDAYGGAIENRCRLVLEVLQAVLEVWPADKVGIRISPSGTFNSMSDSNPEALFTFLLEKLNSHKLAYVHVVEVNEADLRHGGRKVDTEVLRKAYHGNLMVCGDYTAERAIQAVDSKLAELVAFGRLYIANPDLPQRLQLGAELNTPDVNTFYGGTDKGYIDYPTLSEQAASV